MKTLAFLCLALLAPLSAREPLRLLMIGNSYTAQTHRQIEGFLRADPRLEPTFAIHSPGGAFMDQHAANPKVAELLKQPWDVIVLQEQSQLPAFAMAGDAASLKRFEDGGKALIRLVRKAAPDARILLFQTWARHPATRDGTLRQFDGDPGRMQDALAKGYAQLARRGGRDIEVVEVGRAFERWYKAKGYEDPAFTLHKPDGSHPSATGAWLTGAVMYRAITGRDPAQTGYRGISEELIKPLLDTL